MIKKGFYYTIVAVFAIVMVSCRSSKQVAYFQNADNVDLTQSRTLYDARIMPKDQLTITVSSTNPTAATQFNLAVSANNSGVLSSNTNSTLLPYLVENDGTILFPIVGRLKVEGLTKLECQQLITEKIRPFFSSNETPIVTVRLSSYRVTVLGEVARPSVISVATEKISILEALASAGDLTIYGKRDNIIVIREDNKGEKAIHRINLNDANVINSPYYYLQQNDVVYVEPNSTKAKNSDLGTVSTFTMSLISTLMSMTSFIINLVR